MRMREKLGLILFVILKAISYDFLYFMRLKKITDRSLEIEAQPETTKLVDKDVE